MARSRTNEILTVTCPDDSGAESRKARTFAGKLAKYSRLKLYIWPGAWGLPSLDAHSLAAAVYLQLAAPGKFLLVESSDPDVAPHGQ